MQKKNISDPTNTQSWKQLKTHFEEIKREHLNTMFKEDPLRAKKFTISLDDLLVDISKNLITETTRDLLISLANEMKLSDSIDALFNGDKINTTEDRPALHTALRSTANKIMIGDENVRPVIEAELNKMQGFCEQIHNHELKGTTGKIIDTVINIGIGGSDLGPRLVTEALNFYAHNGIQCYFVANIDETEIQTTLEHCNPETTLVILASKSFTTLETMTNGVTARKWFLENDCEDMSKHFVAITANNQAAIEFGITKNNIFSFWPWVGGRYSLWSAIGLPIAIAIGMDKFRELLSGAELMDNHFITAAFDKNIPVLLALLDVWYSNFFKAETLAIIPYDQNLRLLPDYLSQLIMESNGKSVNKQGEEIIYNTSPIIWGTVGTNGQHAFFQLLHQGSHTVPIDFIVGMNSHYNDATHHRALVANCLAQSEALIIGHTPENNNESHRNFTGNKPSTTIIYDQLNPKTMGMLIALYEQRTYVQGCIYNINSFDQWGVELGKKLSGKIIEEFSNGKSNQQHDPSTKQFIKHYIKFHR